MVDVEDHATQHRLALEALIRAEIKAAGGQLSFDRFMELALYAPGLGYYVAGATKLGAAGDFVTAPEISPLFGRCLAVSCREVLTALEAHPMHSRSISPSISRSISRSTSSSPSNRKAEAGTGTGNDHPNRAAINSHSAEPQPSGTVPSSGADLLELGAGTGALAAELLASLAEQGPLPDHYLILEPSPDLAERQRQTLSARVPALLERCHWLDRLPAQFDGIVIANEVLDAMPVNRFQIGNEGQIQEVCVGIDRDHDSNGDSDGDSERFIDRLSESASPALIQAVLALQSAGLATQPGYRSEINLRLAPWTQALGAMLGTGLILVIDYGYPRAEFYLAERDQGTLMCHSRHQAHADPYRDIGLQDLTAHVDFTALAEAGRCAGLDLAGYTTQANFLIGCGIDALIAEAAATDPMAMLELTAGAKQLLLPSLMGERFQVLGLSKGLDELALSGFSVRDLSARL
ncbi:SAM-dependent methyltransferase [Lamprobacter modestohalophilus]|uniref:class I SAM-dependent methyltransferase n=1 Tax=Lamprobacter modestohalophilus TaxID=1064514 RepID=UPI002ADEB633|nr:SAM-dependent methyltransferase [Lamprobacter modestohalophilus]MEA1048471.1 SAM-dependent methyltransferase [Lamprobacter modestohalophilus]